jgi:hypothetical protein
VEATGADPRWRRDGIWIRLVLFALRAACTLPPLPAVGPGPADWAAGDQGIPDGIDPGVLRRILALLAKAESTTFPEEADALSAKAQELISRHALDAAALDAGRSGGPRPGQRRVWFDRPYLDGKSYLLQHVAEPNRCRSLYFSDLGFSAVVGHAADLDVVEVLFTSLLVQATRAMVAAGAQRDRSGRSRTRTFRSSFFVGFAQRIGERLRAAVEVATEAVSDEVRAAALPVLARRSDAVDEAMRAAFPGAHKSGVKVRHGGGYLAGQIAADGAHLAAGEIGDERRA